MVRRWLLRIALLLCATGCAAIAGLDEDFAIGLTTATGAGATTGSGGTPTGTGGMPSGGGGLGGTAGNGASGGNGGFAGSGGSAPPGPPPLPITQGLLLHLDAYSASNFVLVSGSDVDRWLDRSGHQNDFVFPAGSRGSFVGGGDSSQNYYDNQGTGIPTPPVFTTQLNEFTFTAWLDPNQTGYHCVYDNYSNKPMLWYDPTDGWEVDINDLEGVPDPPGAFGSVAVANRNAGAFLRELYVDGTSQLGHAQRSYDGTTLDVTWLRRDTWSHQISLAKWKELLLYDHGLTSAEIATLHAYFVDKWQ